MTTGARENGAMATEEPNDAGIKTESDAFPFGKPPLLTPEIPFNPFRNNTTIHFSYLDYLQMVLIFPLLVLRSFGLILLLVLGFIFTKIAMIGADDNLETAFPKWRQILFWPLRLCARAFLFCLGYHWIYVNGKCAPREVAPIIVSNHVTFVDPIFIFFAHFAVFVNAKENLKLPIAGSIMRAVKVIAVDRENPDSRKIVSEDIQLRANCNDWNHLAIFPEATTTNGRSIVSFKLGAFKPGFPVQPVIIKYPHIKIDPSWVADGPPIHMVLFYLMTQFHNYMEVQYLPVIQPNANEAKNPKLFADRTRSIMAKQLNVNVTEHSFSDVVLTLEAEKLKMDKKFVNVEFGQFEKVFKLEVSTAKAFLRKFKMLDRSKNGAISYDDFLNGFHLSDNWSAKKVFEMFDTNHKGGLTFREYLAGVSFILKHEKFSKIINTLFKQIDFDGDGILNENEKITSFQFLLPDSTADQVTVILKEVQLADDGSSVDLAGFTNFFTKNPEYLAVILTYKPFLIK